MASSGDPTEIGGRLDRAVAGAAARPRPASHVVRSAAMIGLAGPLLAEAEAELLHALRPAGVFLFRRNIGTPAEIRALTAAIRAAADDETFVAIDQEGGRVARLRPPDFRVHPPAAAIGGERAAWLTGALIGGEAVALGIDMVSAPVLDRTIAGADAVIGDRAYIGSPETVAALGRAMAEGLGAAGVVPIGKHIPGHGRAMADSHLALPELDDIDAADLVPFIANRDLPAMMTAHIRYRTVDPVHAATVSPAVIGGVVRGRIGYAGLLISDDLGMQALSGTPPVRARAAIAAGCDLALHCSGRLDESRDVCLAAGELTQAGQARVAAARAWVMARRRTDLPDASALEAERAELLERAPA